jgi:asparagine synthetase B (glutamine-hydrolysing)
MKIRIGFNRTKGRFNLFDWGIRKFQGTNHSHTYLVTENEVVWQADAFGVRPLMYSEMIEGHEVLLEVEIDISTERYSDVMAFLHVVRGRPYSYWAIFKILFHITKWKDYRSRAFICSELVARCLKEELCILDEELDLITPKEIYWRVEKYITKGGTCEEI